MEKAVLILGANSEVAKQCTLRYVKEGFTVMACSRNLTELQDFLDSHGGLNSRVSLHYFDACDFELHQSFYHSLPTKPSIVLYAAGFLAQNAAASSDFSQMKQMADVNYLGAVSILNTVVGDFENRSLKRIVGISSLSGVRGRKSNFMYGSTKAAFTQYLAGLRQNLSSRKITVNVVVSGYIDTKINNGLALNKSLLMTPAFVADHIVSAGKKFEIIPGYKWKLIAFILKILPEKLVAKMP